MARVYSYDAKTDLYVVMIIPIIFNTLGLLGALYIFYRTYLRWKCQCRKSYKNVSLSFRFPFYIAITDFLFSLTSLINISYPFSTGLSEGDPIVLPSPYCELVSVLATSTVLLNVLLVGAISVITWLRVVRAYYVELGKYDYKIWLPVIFLSFIIPTTSVKDFGPEEYWCGSKASSHVAVIALIVLGMISATLVTILFCYIQVLRTIRNAKDNLDSSNSSSIPTSGVTLKKHDGVKGKTLKKVLTYILVFIMQYIPIAILDICRFLRIQHVAIYALTPSAISLGGIGNVIQYVRNEGLSSSSPSPIRGNGDEFKENEQITVTTNTITTNTGNTDTEDSDISS